MDATVTPIEANPSGSRDTRWAWWSLALMPLAFVAAFVVGEGIPAWLGYDVAAAGPPWWVIAIALLSALVALAMPMLVTGLLSRRAAAAREPGAWIPLIVNASIVAGFALVNVVSGLMVVIFE